MDHNGPCAKSNKKDFMMKVVARKITLVVAGKDEAAMEDALSEASRLINQGCRSGMNSNDSSAFYFDSTDDVPDGELPAGC